MAEDVEVHRSCPFMGAFLAVSAKELPESALWLKSSRVVPVVETGLLQGAW